MMEVQINMNGKAMHPNRTLLNPARKTKKSGVKRAIKKSKKTKVQRNVNMAMKRRNAYR